MKIKKSILPLLMASVLAASGCTSADSPDPGSTGSSQSKNTESRKKSSTDTAAGTDSQSGDTADSADSPAADPGSRVSASDLFSDRDLQNGYDEKGSAAITLKGTGASCSSDAVKISGSRITITDEGTYILSGTLQDGMVIVDADKSDKVQIVLNGADISCSSSAAVYVRQADKVFLTTAADTENSLSNGGTYEAVDENKIDSVIFSKDDLTLNGEGSLSITAKAGHGIVSKDDLVLTGGSYEITAEDHGLSGKDSVCIADGTFKITSGKDGIHAENTDDASLGFLFISDGEFDITAEGDGISSAYFGQIEDGSFRIQAGGGCKTALMQPQSGQNAADSKSGQSTADSKSGQNAIDRQPVQSLQSDGNIRTAENLSATAAAQDSLPPENMPELKQPASDFKPSDTQADSSGTDAQTASTKGIKAGGNLWLDSGTFAIDSADDALHSNSSISISGGSYQLASGDDGIHADDNTAISGGTVSISQSYEGIEGKTVDISGGDITLTADDDGINAAGGADGSGFGAHKDSFASSDDASITISGGTMHVKASGDGIDSNGNLTVTGGKTYVCGPSGSGNGSLDYNGEASITGGIFAASGAMGMAQNFGSSSTQGAMLVQTDAGTAGDDISLADASGNVLVTWKAETDYGCVIISCPQLEQGNTYTLTAGNSSSQIEMSSLIYGQGGGRGGMDGGRGGMNGGRSGMDGGKGTIDGSQRGMHGGRGGINENNGTAP